MIRYKRHKLEPEDPRKVRRWVFWNKKTLPFGGFENNKFYNRNLVAVVVHSRIIFMFTNSGGDTDDLKS